jgi:hypothetical protein
MKRLTAFAAALGVALALLGESFGREAWWLWRHRDADAVEVLVESVPTCVR